MNSSVIKNHYYWTVVLPAALLYTTDSTEDITLAMYYNRNKIRPILEGHPKLCCTILTNKYTIHTNPLSPTGNEVING